LQVPLPKEVEVMNPYKKADSYKVCQKFYGKYYNDNYSRHLILGINSGRFGGGITGVPFTDPIRLLSVCEIENNFEKKQELSSVFIYDMIKAFGGATVFYTNFYISSICPLGFTKYNKNLNYYDDKDLEKNIKSFVIQSLQQQLAFGLRRDVVFCLGEGKNFKYLSKLNDEMKFFDMVVPLPHPRFIMQYKLRRQDEYIQRYLLELGFTAHGGH
ncbi:MAG: uracil-DNA glycosylase family protein, partial [Ginsengibacter sp.]